MQQFIQKMGNIMSSVTIVNITAVDKYQTEKEYNCSMIHKRGF